MKSFFPYIILLFFLPVFISCDDFECSEAQDEIESATNAYTAALDSGGDGAEECATLMAALEKLIDESTCPEDSKQTTQGLLDALDCD